MNSLPTIFQMQIDNAHFIFKLYACFPAPVTWMRKFCKMINQSDFPETHTEEIGDYLKAVIDITKHWRSPNKKLEDKYEKNLKILKEVCNYAG